MAKITISAFTMKRLITSLLLLTVAHGAQAQSYLNSTPPPNGIEDRFRLEAGVMQSTYETQIRIDPSASTQGTLISGEQDLKLDESKLNLQMELTLLPGKHHLVRLHGLSMRRDGSTVLTRTIVWDNNTYTAGERVDSHLNVSMVGLTYGWLPLRKNRYELGLTIGIQIADVNANAEVRSRAVRPDDGGIAPIPLVGLEGRFDISKRWSLDARYQYLKVNISDVEASLKDSRFSLRFRQNQHLLWGLGYRDFALDVLSTNIDTPGLVHIAMKGPVLYVQGSL
jgi:hypothetical protein